MRSLHLASISVALLSYACRERAVMPAMPTDDEAQALASAYTGSPISLPGIVEAENFDRGGEGVAYHDTTAGNALGEYRSTRVDIGTTGDVGGGYSVGWTDKGEWLGY